MKKIKAAFLNNLKAKLKSLALLLAILLMSLLPTIASTSNLVGAQNPPAFNWDVPVKPSQVEDVIRLEPLIYCMRYSFRQPTLSKATVDGGFNIFNSSLQNEFAPITSAVTQNTVLTGDGSVQDIQNCKFARAFGMIAAQNLFGSTENFLKLFYDYRAQSPGPGQPGQTWYAKSNIQALSTEYLNKAVYSSDTLKKANLAYISSIDCLKGSGNNLDYQDGIDSSTSVPIPMAIGPTTLTNCGELRNKWDSEVKPWLENYSNLVSGIGNFTVDNIRNSPDALYRAIRVKAQADRFRTQAKDKFLEVFNAAPDILNTCLASSGIGTLGNQVNPGSGSAISTSEDVASFMAGITNDIDLDPNDSTKEDSLKLCLEQNYGSFVKTIENELADNLTNIGANTNSGSTTPGTSSASQSQEDQCIEGDVFTGWFVCPALGIIQKALGGLENTIKGMLDFKVGLNGGSSEKDIREAWNTFRSIANILVIIGFLVALLVQTIKGGN